MFCQAFHSCACRISGYKSLYTVRYPAQKKTLDGENLFNVICSLMEYAGQKNHSLKSSTVSKKKSYWILQPVYCQKRSTALQNRTIGSIASKQCDIVVENATNAEDIVEKHQKCVPPVKPAQDSHSNLANVNQALKSNLKNTEGDFLKQPTIFVFDIETTGFSNNDRIVEFAAQDLAGGQYSTIQCLVNPECCVNNSYIHGITTEMVNKPDVPKWKDFAPLLIRYVKSRQKDAQIVIWVAHNARFDVRFLVTEFKRCSMEIPSDWIFVDSLAMARKLNIMDGSKRGSIKLEALREYYSIASVEEEHRAMADVKILALVLQKLTFDLKIPVSDFFSYRI